MADKFIIKGGKKLAGSIEVRGAKNAAFAVLAATLLTKETCTIENVPLIKDIFVMLEIFKSIGVQYEFISKRTLRISAAALSPKNIDHDVVEKIRASVLLCGALPARTARFSLTKPGGCSIGSRILEPHFDALAQVGIDIKKRGKYLDVIRRENSGDHEIVLSEMSVTATENAVLASVIRTGTVTIYCAAAEPYVQDLCHMLVKMGATISGIGTHTLTIKGVARLHGVTHCIMPDPIEMGTFIALAASTKSRIVIKNTVPEFIRFDLLKFAEAGVIVKIRNRRKIAGGWGYEMADMEVVPSKLVAIPKVHNMPYPGLSPDLLPMFVVLMTQAHGVSLIHDWMYEGRMKYVEELRHMGADAFICDPHRALITGPTPLEGRNITSFDLRAGAVLIIAALTAKGTTVIQNAYQVDRGYEDIEGRLKKIGALIERTQ
ncbi:MAG: UDP-N-acetylglucosamine 1-carboxyvinyltransferase [Candidatus Azambacteria bacterium]|nr:UDP-N-acetylglucosamine 1-carboxyvinyltransferase [Candidatus Azambacteria bacterium]